MTVVLGVDGSFTGTGVGVWTNGGVHTFTVKTDPETARVHRETEVVDHVLSWVGSAEPTYAIIEAVYQGGFGRVSLDLSGLHDVIVYELIKHGVHVGVVSPRSLKAFATGDGNANKKRMLHNAQSLLGITCANHNEADALWLATMGVVALGGQVTNFWPPAPDHPVAVENQKARETALSKVTWIDGPPIPVLKEN